MPRRSRFRLQPLRMGIHWKVAWNSFYEIDPPASRDGDEWLFLGEDLLLLANTSARVLIDVSWMPWGPRGRFVLSAVNWLGHGEMPEQWDRPLLQYRSRSRERIVAKLDEWLDSEYAWVAVKRTAAAKVAQPLKLSHVRNQKLFEAESG